MPWVARCTKRPKLTGGFPFVEGAYYIVTKSKTNDKQVLVMTISYDNETTLVKGQARQIFEPPKWVSDDNLLKVNR